MGPVLYQQWPVSNHSALEMDTIRISKTSAKHQHQHGAMAQPH